MCDYSLEHLASRPAKVGDKLVTTKFSRSLTRRLLRNRRAQRCRLSSAWDRVGI